MAIENIQFSHVGFAVRDIHKAIEWYADILGFNTLLPPGVMKMDLMGHEGLRCMIQNNQGVCLELESRSDIDFPSNISPIISHFSLEVEDIEAMQNHLKEKGVISKNENLIVDKKIVKILYFTGLDGVRIELIQYS